MATAELDLGRYKLGWSDAEDFYVYKPKKGLSEEIMLGAVVFGHEQIL